MVKPIELPLSSMKNYVMQMNRVPSSSNPPMLDRDLQLSNQENPPTKFQRLEVPCSIRQADCGWIGLMETGGHLYAYFSTPDSDQLVRAEFGATSSALALGQTS